MVNRFVKWSEKSYPVRQRLMVMIPLGLVFLLLIPGMILGVSKLDQLFNIPELALGPPRIIVAVVFAGAGFFMGIWTVITQFDEAAGTPIPMMPTQKLITNGPYGYCRNPMVLGTMIAYFGVVILSGSLSSFILYFLLMSALLVYVKRIEEKELEVRFGEEYLAYKTKVPFIIPYKKIL